MKTKRLVFSNISMSVILTAMVVMVYAFTFSTAFAATVPTVNVSINNESNLNVTSVPVGTVVHLNTSVSSSTGPIATGIVDFNSFQNKTCSGTAAVQSGVVLVNGIANSATTTVGSNGLSYRASYVATGDVYASTTSSCVSVATTTVSTPPTPTPGTGSISGVAYNDVNTNFKRDGGEAGISGFTMKLYGGNFWWWGKNKNMPISQTVTTDANGVYTFSNLVDGVYKVEEIKMGEWVQISSDYHWVLVVNGKALTGLDFANGTKDAYNNWKSGKKIEKKEDNKEKREDKKEEQKNKKINKLQERIEKIKSR